MKRRIAAYLAFPVIFLLGTLLRPESQVMSAVAAGLATIIALNLFNVPTLHIAGIMAVFSYVLPVVILYEIARANHMPSPLVTVLTTLPSIAWVEMGVPVAVSVVVAVGYKDHLTRRCS